MLLLLGRTGEISIEPLEPQCRFFLKHCCCFVSFHPLHCVFYNSLSTKPKIKNKTKKRVESTSLQTKSFKFTTFKCLFSLSLLYRTGPARVSREESLKRHKARTRAKASASNARRVANPTGMGYAPAQPI